MNGSGPKNNATNVGQIYGRPRDFEKYSSGFNHPDDMPLGKLNPLTLDNYPVGPSHSTLDFLPKFQPKLPAVFDKLAEDSEYLKYGRGILEAEAEKEARDARMENLPWLNGYNKNIVVFEQKPLIQLELPKTKIPLPSPATTSTYPSSPSSTTSTYPSLPSYTTSTYPSALSMTMSPGSSVRSPASLSPF